MHNANNILKLAQFFLGSMNIPNHAMSILSRDVTQEPHVQVLGASQDSLEDLVIWLYTYRTHTIICNLGVG